MTEDNVEYTPLVDKVFMHKANLLYKDWKWRMSDHYAKFIKDGKDAYANPFEGITPEGWKYLIDHIFNDPNWQVN